LQLQLQLQLQLSLNSAKNLRSYDFMCGFKATCLIDLIFLRVRDMK
ncbi:hypothetical protein HMPREF1420_01382, partial [Helicobacter pylori GAM264Ai]